MADSGFSSYYSSSNQNQASSNCQKLDAAVDSDCDDADENKENERKNNLDLAASNSKKMRTTFTEQQKRALDVYFQRNPYPDPRETEELSQQLVLPENVIKVWFQNKRSRDKQRKFSHKSRAAVSHNQHQQVVLAASDSSSLLSTSSSTGSFSSPLVANLQMLTSRFANSYAAAAAAAAVQAQHNLNSKLYF